MKNSQKGFVVPLLIGIIALLVIGGGVYIYQNEKVEVPVVVDTTQPSITLLSPNGDEMWEEDKTYQIGWTSKNISLDAPGYVALTQDGRVVKVIRSIALNGGSLSDFGGSFSWTLPQEFVSEASPGKFKILISSSDNTVSDYSDNSFTIYASAAGY